MVNYFLKNTGLKVGAYEVLIIPRLSDLLFLTSIARVVCDISLYNKFKIF